jgi:hypothetical protein
MGRSTTNKPLYPRLLRLRHIEPNMWQRALLGEGAIAVAVLLVLADLASAWTLLALPVAVAVVVKAHDVLAGTLERQSAAAASRPATARPQAEFSGAGRRRSARTSTLQTPTAPDSEETGAVGAKT